MTEGRTPEGFIVLGHITRAHGVHGAFVVVAYSEDPQSVLSAGQLELLSPDGLTRLPVDSLKGKVAAQGLIVKIKGVSTREAAAALKGWRLGLERRYLPEAEEDEVYLADLVGLEVRTPEGLTLGRVLHLMEAGVGLILVVARAEEPEKEILLPFHEEFVLDLDMENRRLLFDPPPGLLDL